MKTVITEENARPIKIWTTDIEDPALRQLKNLARLPFIADNGVAVMPDVHAGKGSTIGTVIATKRAIIPAAVGVDIGCGMNAVRLSLKASDLPDSLAAVRSQIERDVPLGARGRHTNDHQIQDNHARLPDPSGKAKHVIDKGVFGERANGWEQAMAKASQQLGTLGSGNHFIELCLDENEDVWVMLHSGSRGIGNIIGSHFIGVAQNLMDRNGVELPDRDLAFLEESSEEFDDYIEALAWAQDYAFKNRELMMEKVILALRKTIGKEFVITQEAINCHHNYATREEHFGENLWVTRKGAIRAREGDLGIIPGSMGQRSYIVRGKGNETAYCSCSHGAGRKMSRDAARRHFTVEDLVAQTQGVECLKNRSVLDEIPGAYKDIDQVMANQTDLVEVVHTLKQVLCVKGA